MIHLLSVDIPFIFLQLHWLSPKEIFGRLIWHILISITLFQNFILYKYSLFPVSGVLLRVFYNQCFSYFYLFKVLSVLSQILKQTWVLLHILLPNCTISNIQTVQPISVITLLTCLLWLLWNIFHFQKRKATCIKKQEYSDRLIL